MGFSWVSHGFTYVYLEEYGVLIVLTIHAPKSKRESEKWDPEDDSPIGFGDFWGSVSKFGECIATPKMMDQCFKDGIENAFL